VPHDADEDEDVLVLLVLLGDAGAESVVGLWYA